MVLVGFGMVGQAYSVDYVLRWCLSLRKPRRMIGKGNERSTIVADRPCKSNCTGTQITSKAIGSDLLVLNIGLRCLFWSLFVKHIALVPRGRASRGKAETSERRRYDVVCQALSGI